MTAYFRRHSLFGSVRTVNYTEAYVYANRMTRVFCRLLGDRWDPQTRGRYSIDVYSTFWKRRAEQCIRDSDFCYEDELPGDMKEEDRKLWFRHSDKRDSGKRIGPSPETLHIEAPAKLDNHHTHPIFEKAY